MIVIMIWKDIERERERESKIVVIAVVHIQAKIQVRVIDDRRRQTTFFSPSDHDEKIADT